MFTGIIKETGEIKSVVRKTGLLEITINSTKVSEDASVDDSVAVNGVCLTVVRKDRSSFTVQAVKETASMTNIQMLSPGDKVNLEPSLRPLDRMGGHIVQGHIDGKGEVIAADNSGAGKEFRIKADRTVLKYIVTKGSICLDGISLTVADVKAGVFRTAVIPHTLNFTTAGDWKPGTKINIETDIIGRYIEKFTESSDKLTFDKLKELGY